ncbi:MAG: peptidase domain-containing ABC transporter [Muribaculaceae bacterium]|nr:peptidase domain-containing ABC transporter [Muribaculaceae bacterium]
MRKPGFKLFRQLEQSDCGLSCIRMICHYYGKNVSLQYLRDITECNKQGISLQDIHHAFDSLGMRSAEVRIPWTKISEAPLPAILFWRQSHFVVLYHINPEKKVYYIADPDKGKVRLDEKKFLHEWIPEGEKGIIVLAEPGTEFAQEKASGDTVLKRMLHSIKGILRKNARSFFYILILSIICMGADLAIPLMVQSSVDEGIRLKSLNIIWTLMACQLMVVIGSLISTNLIQYFSALLSARLEIDMLRTYLIKLLKKPLSFFDRISSADLIQKINDQSRLKEYIFSFPTTTILLLLNVVVFMGLLIWYNVYLFLVFIALTSIEILWNIFFLHRRRQFDYSLNSQSSKNRNTIYEAIIGIQDIKGSGASGVMMKRWEKTQQTLMDTSIRSRVLGMKQSAGNSLLLRFKDILLTSICATLVVKNMLTIGEMLAVGYVIGRLSGPFSNILMMIQQSQDAYISYQRLDEIISTKEIEKPIDGKISSAIEFRGVWFRYPGKSNPFVLRDLNLKITPGQKIAIVGESGCGKSTLIKLILGLYAPQKGNLWLGGVNIHSLNDDQWLEQCGIVLQNGYIFSDSILNNIAITSEHPDRVKVNDVLNLVGLLDFVNSLPLGINTIIGSSGIELSGGQKQRILIARALYKNPSILIMDEATSSLDAINETMITDRIMEDTSDRILIVAAHRLCTVKNADKILLLDKGNIIEEGTHNELLNMRGKYFHLIQSQLMSE